MTDWHGPRQISGKSKTEIAATVILRDSIVKSIYDNAITKSAKHKKHIVVKHFSGAKVDDIKALILMMRLIFSIYYY